MKTLIVDDEPIARQVLREKLEDCPDVSIVGEAETGMQALEQIQELHPDLVFLDLQMPVMGGFDVVRNLGGGGYMPIVVIVTAHDEHAIEAFDTGAIDYLLKPVSEARLQKALERARGLRNKPLGIGNEVARIDFASVPPTSTANRKFVGRSGSEYILLDPNEILAFQAEGELVWIVTSKQRLVANQTLGALDRVQDQQFQRVRRNAIVNVNHVRKMSAMSSRRWLLTLSNASQIVVSRRQAHKIRKLLHW